MGITVGGISIDIGANPNGVITGMGVAKAAVRAGVDSMQGALESMKSYLMALGGGLTVGAFASIVKGSIDSAAGLHDLSIQTGASVAALMAFRSVASTSTTSIESIGGAMNKMAKGMAVANEDSKGVGDAIKALGLDFSALKSMRPEDQMLAVAVAMNKFEDGTGKSAVAMTLWGKEGAKMLPFMKDLADESETVIKKMTEQEVEAKRIQAAMADDFGDNLTKIKKASDAWKKDVAMAMLPALWELAQAFRDVTEGPGGIKAEISELAADGSILRWTRASIEGITYVMDAFAGLKAVTISLGESIGFMAASIMLRFEGIGKLVGQVISGDFAGAAETYKATTLSQQQMTESFHATLDKTWGEQTLGSKLRDRMAELQQVGYVAKKAKESLDFDAGGDGGASKEAARLREEQAKLMAELSGLSGSFSRDWKSLTALFATGAMNMEQLVDAQAKLLAKQPGIKAMYDSELKSAKEIAEARQAARNKEDEGIQKYLEAQQERYNQEVKASNDSLKAAEAEYAQYGMSKTQIAEITLLTLQKKQAEQYTPGSAPWESIQKQIDNQKKLIEVLSNTEALDEQKSMWSSIESTAHSTFTNIFQGGQDAFTKLRDVLKATLLDMLYQMTVKKWIFNIAAGVSGSGVASAAIAGMAGASGDSGSSGGIGSMIGSAVGGLGSFGAGASYGFQSLFANGLGGTLSAGSSMLGAGSTMAGLGTIVGALGPIVLGLGVLSKAMSYTVTPTGNALTATVGSKGLVNGTVGTRADFRQEGGLFGGGVTNNSTWGVADAGTTGYVDNAVKGITAANKAYAEILGLNSAALDDYTAALEINTTGLDEAGIKTAINTAVTQFGADQVTAAFGPMIAEFARAGETASDTLRRLAETALTAQALNQLGGIFSKIAAGGLEATDSMISLAGGIDKLIAKSAAFVKNYYSSDEQVGMQARDVIGALTAAGLSPETIAGLTSKAEFRKLVESIDTSTEEGRKQLNALLDIGPQFAELSTSFNAQHSDLKSLADLAPQMATLSPLFADGTDKTADATSKGADATVASINATTDAVNSGTQAVVSAIGELKGVMSGVVTRLDNIETNGRLANSGANFG